MNKEERPLHLLNRKKFTGDYEKHLIEEITKKYKQMPYYEHHEIIVKQNSEASIYSFCVYLVAPIITAQNTTNANILIKEYKNVDAIKLFSTKYTIDEYNNQFNDHCYGNYKLIEQAIKELEKEYENTGIEIVSVRVGENYYSFSVEYPHMHKSKYFSHYFSITPVSLKMIQKYVTKIKNETAKYVAECIADTLK